MENRKIYIQTSEYVVYAEGPTLGFDLSESAPKAHTAINDVSDRITTIRINTDNYSWPFKSYQDKSASILIAAVANQSSVALASIEELERKVIKTKNLLARLRYALIAFILFLICSAGLIIILNNHNFDFQKVLASNISLLCCCILFSGIGGFISIVARLHTLDIDIYAPWSLLGFTGVLRLSLAMACGMLAFFIMKGKIVSFVGDPDNIFAYFVISCVAGASEHFIPGVLEKLGGEAKSNPTS